MSTLVNSETVTWQWAPESAAGTLAAALWKEGQAEPGGISNAKRDTTLQNRNPLSKRMQVEQGDIVGLAAAPSFNHDLNMDVIDAFGNAMFLATGSHSGNTGLALFKPTAVTATGYTVAALGALTNNFIVRAIGFRTAANNGVKVCAGISTGTEIKAAGLTAETVSGYTPLVEVAGWQGAAGDIGIDASGNLTSTAAVFASWNVKVGQWIYLGGDAGVAGTNFANTLYRGWAKIKIIAAGLLTLERRDWTVGAADAGATKTIQIYFGRFWTNRAFDHADSLTAEAVQPNFSHEVSYPGAAAAAATSYAYGLGCMLAAMSISAPEMTKIAATLNFVGRDFTAPTTVRATGASASEAPIKSSLFNTAHHIRRIKCCQKSNDASLLVDISSWSLNINRNISPQTQQGVLGARRMVIGEFGASFDVSGYLVQDDSMAAAADARQVTFDVAIRNAQGAILFDVPNGQLTPPDTDFPENGAVTLGTQVMASRDADFYDTTLGMSTFPYTPAS